MMIELTESEIQVIRVCIQKEMTHYSDVSPIKSMLLSLYNKFYIKEG